jgi:hypothetical protein
MRRSIGRGMAWGPAVVCGVFLASVAQAAPTTYTTRAAFLAALPGSSQTLNFDSLAAGTLIPSGGVQGGITFTYSISDVNGPLTMEVRNDFGTTSSPNYLGLNSVDGTFLNGDSFTMGFGSPVTALGLYVVTPTNQIDLADDFELRATGSGTVQNSATADRFAPDPNGYNAYFLGLIDPAGFSQAQLVSDTGCDPSTGCQIVFNIDDITTGRSGASVPEPSTLVTLGLGLTGLARYAWRRRRT